MLINSIRLSRSATLLTALMLLSACASSIKVTGDIPSPLVPKLPLTGQLVISDELKRYNYEEKEKGRALKNLDFGQAQADLFTGIFSSVLTLVDETQAFDLRIAPELLDFQYSVPRETKLKLYEVFLKYRVKITKADDSEVADWVVKGYGKTPTALLTSADKAFNAATNVALRDIGAQLSIGFPRQDAIAQMLDDRKASAALDANASSGADPALESAAVESAPIENTSVESSPSNEE